MNKFYPNNVNQTYETGYLNTLSCLKTFILKVEKARSGQLPQCSLESPSPESLPSLMFVGPNRPYTG